MPFWADERCPGDWQNRTHKLGPAGKCAHCYELPDAWIDPNTGETA